MQGISIHGGQRQGAFRYRFDTRVWAHRPARPSMASVRPVTRHISPITWLVPRGRKRRLAYIERYTESREQRDPRRSAECEALLPASARHGEPFRRSMRVLL